MRNNFAALAPSVSTRERFDGAAGGGLVGFGARAPGQHMFGGGDVHVEFPVVIASLGLPMAFGGFHGLVLREVRIADGARLREATGGVKWRDGWWLGWLVDVLPRAHLGACAIGPMTVAASLADVILPSARPVRIGGVAGFVGDGGRGGKCAGDTNRLETASF